MNRRKLLSSASALTAAAALSGCGLLSFQTVNGVTTVTVSLTLVNDYAQGAETAAKLLMALPVVAGPLGVAGAIAANAVITALINDIAALNTAYAGAASFSFDTGSVPKALASVQADIAKLFAGFTAVQTANGGTVPTAATQYFDAFQTIVTLVTSLGSAAVGAPQTPMTQAQAFAVLGVKT